MAIQKITSGILADGAIVAADIANGSITTAKIADGNVTSAKIDTVANTKITGLVTASQIANVANTQVTGSIEATQVGTTVSQLFGMRNRIINGDMDIDQRNSGAATTPSDTGVVYNLDRWTYANTQASKLTIQRTPSATETGFAVRVGAGFTNYLSTTVASAYTPLTADLFAIAQFIEGLNINDLAWGTASAKTVTLSFWVNSSLTGTFGGAISNSALDRSYPFTYTISVANTWEQKTITIAGDTTGTWLTTNAIGMRIYLSLGAGATYTGTAGAWAAGGYTNATGATNVIDNASATWRVTGVQLEIGTSATPFERRLFDKEFASCQRYYQTLPFDGGFIAVGAAINTSAARGPLLQLYRNMRVAPTVTLPASGSGAGQLHYTTSSGGVPATIGTNSVLGVQVNSFRVEGDSYTSMFTAGQTSLLRLGTGGASITASAEL